MSDLRLVSNRERPERSLNSLHSKSKTPWDRYHTAANALLSYVEAADDYHRLGTADKPFSTATVAVIKTWQDAKTDKGDSQGNRQAVENFKKNQLPDPSLQDAVLMEWRLSCLENLINKVEQF